MEAEKNPPTTTTTTEKKPEQVAKNDVDLPTNSPYVDESGTLEDYKMKAYGAKGHQEVKAGLGGGATDAPTPSSDAPAATKAP
ncbi:hypothetical protein EUTSA_v10000405mg [Eutrema salsugineum]|uniref:Late embryogenesis abundant protein, LEA-18 n=1 Tax=Eutrema salsugineum TaxID=72664 RepID=V4LR00_EUTSA|nr:uncharacterized protein LOC18021780 [Eutrema salsugineum]ESQ46234.1 hypothetical protein EUTSA_v10000405mg [Eutrema salsugineum]